MNEENITQILNVCGEEDLTGSRRFSKSIYQELHKIARSHRRRWSGNHTLNTTSLIHEAYVKLAPLGGHYKNRTHFYATAAKIMRQVLVNYAERNNAEKRSPPPTEIDSGTAPENHYITIEELLFVNQLLKKIETKNERHCRIVECRIFGGMSIQETAQSLQISPATVKREWSLLSAWLYRELDINNRGRSTTADKQEKIPA